jgi:hypothetical protein
VGFNDSQPPSHDSNVRITNQCHLLDLVKREGRPGCGRLLVLRQ